MWPRKIPLPTAQRVEKGVKVVPGAEGCDLLAGPWPWSHPFCALCTRGEALGPAEGSRGVGNTPNNSQYTASPRAAFCISTGDAKPGPRVSRGAQKEYRGRPEAPVGDPPTFLHTSVCKAQ